MTNQSQSSPPPVTRQKSSSTENSKKEKSVTPARNEQRLTNGNQTHESKPEVKSEVFALLWMIMQDSGLFRGQDHRH